jgi:hypothetical protein
MVRRKVRESLIETKRRLTRQQIRGGRTETRVRQVLSPVRQEDSDSEEDWNEILARVRQEVRQKGKIREKKGSFSHPKTK